MMDDEIQTISNNIKPTQTILKQFKLFQKKRNDEPRKTGLTQSME
jgi:hypothetical protein